MNMTFSIVFNIAGFAPGKRSEDEGSELGVAICKAAS